MIIPLATGVAFGLGLLLIWRGLHPAPVSLAASLGRFEHVEVSSTKVLTEERFGSFLPLARWTLSLAEALGLSLPKLRRDLAALDRPIEVHFAEKVALGIFGVLLVPLTSAAMALGGVQIPVMVPIWAAIVLSLILFFAPDIGIRSEASDRRADFRHSLGSFLDLVVIGVAGGSGIESALQDAASAGDSWAISRIRQSLDDAQLRGETPWAALSRLGQQIGVDELVELSASVGLAGTEGAKVRQSLAAKTATLRAHQLTTAESEAQSSTETMSLPVVMLFAGFLVFIGYPAISRVLTGL